MPQTSQYFGPIYANVTLDASGNGQVSFQAVGSAKRISNIFFRVATSTNQAVCTIYKGQVAVGNIIFNSNSGSTGGNAKGNVDIFDGETVFVRWTGGDASAVATATFTGQNIPFQDMKASNLTFDDQIAAGDGSLIFPALKSPNFVSGTSGWQISRNGDAEFADATIRGTIIAAGGNIVLDDTGLTVVGLDQTVTIYDNGLKVFLNSDPDSFVFMAGNPTLGGVIALHPKDSTVSGIFFTDAFVYVGRDETVTASRPYLKLMSPAISGSPDLHTSQFIMHGQKSDSTVNDAFIEIESPQGFYYTDYDVDAGRGYVSSKGSNTNSAAIGAIEAIVLTIPSKTYKAGRAYQAVISMHCSTSVATNTPIMKVRKTTLGGTQLGFSNVATVNVGQTNGCWTCEFWVDPAADVTCPIVLTFQGSGAYTVTAIQPYSMTINDIGVSTAVDYYAPELA